MAYPSKTGQRRRTSKRAKTRRAMLLILVFAVAGAICLAALTRGNLAEQKDADAGGKAAAQKPRHVVDPKEVYTYDRMREDLESLAKIYPELIETWVMGESAEGRELLAVSLGSGDKTVIMTGAVHGNECFTTGFLMNLLDGYAYGFAAGENENGYSYRELLSEVRFIILPMVNPDGVNIAQNGYDAGLDPAALKAMDDTGTDYSFWKANANGVDINRNFPYNWSLYNETQWPALRYYVGPYAASEPETRAVMALLETTDFDALLDFHVYGESLYWTDSLSYSLAERHRPLAERILELTGYFDVGVEEVDEFAGYLSNYARGIYGVFAATVELTPYEAYPVSEFHAAADRVYDIGLLVADYLISGEPKLEG